MKLGTEALKILENLDNSHGKRVYVDAADWGIPYSKYSTEEIRKAVNDPIGGLKGLEDPEYTPFHFNGLVKAQRYWLPIERDGGVTRGLTVEIKLVKVPHQHLFNGSVTNSEAFAKGYYTVNVRNVSR